MNIIILDSNRRYANRLAARMNEIKEADVLAIPVSSGEEFDNAFEKFEINAMLVNEADEKTVGSGIREKVPCFLLSENLSNASGKTIYKYRPAKELLLAAEQTLEVQKNPKTEERRMIGVFNLFRKEAMTEFLLSLAMKKAERGKTLLVSVNEECAFENWIEKEGTGLSELLYDGEDRDDLDFSKKYQTKIGALDILWPVDYAEDLYELSSLRIFELVMQYVKSGDYETVVVELGENKMIQERFLPVLDCLYMGRVEGFYEEAIFHQYADWMKRVSETEVKIRKIDLPNPIRFPGEKESLSKIIKGEIGNLVDRWEDPNG